jgi:hypothetical protein
MAFDAMSAYSSPLDELSLETVIKNIILNLF